MENARGDELLFSSVRTSKASGKHATSPAAVAQTGSRRGGKPWMLVLWMPRVGNFKRVNAGSGVVVFQYQPWVTTIGN